MKRSEVTFYLVIGTLGAHICTCLVLMRVQDNLYHGMIAMLSVMSAILYTLVKNKGVALGHSLISVSISLGWALAMFTAEAVETKNLAFAILSVISLVASILYAIDTNKKK